LFCFYIVLEIDIIIDPFLIIIAVQLFIFEYIFVKVVIMYYLFFTLMFRVNVFVDNGIVEFVIYLC